jgi:ketosteroid isomerase-like protein
VRPDGARRAAEPDRRVRILGEDMANTEERLARIEARLAQLEDLEGIRRTMAAYCTAVDNKDIQGLAAVFAQDSEFSVVPWNLGAKGHAEIVKFYARAFLDSGATRHYLTNEAIERSGDGYRSVCYFQNSVDAAPQSLRGWGIYEDILVREGGVWKFKSKKVTVQVLGPFDQGWAGTTEVTDVHAGMHEH